MKLYFYFIFFIIISGCMGNNKTYWCGDHPCINNKEREAYFKKNLIVEVKELNKKDKDAMSEIEKITQQARIKEKKRIKNEKKLKKEAKYEEKKKLKEQKKIAKEMKKNKKNADKSKNISKTKKILQKTQPEKKNSVKAESSISDIEFDNIVDAIIKKNESKPYPDLTEMPN